MAKERSAQEDGLAQVLVRQIVDSFRVHERQVVALEFGIISFLIYSKNSQSILYTYQSTCICIFYVTVHVIQSPNY